jgi:alanyl-tRNA synthetase
MNLDDAREEGAAALFGERYEDDVRVVGMGEFSLELCGGTHVSRTGDIGAFRLIAESGIAAGVRRLEALTGEAARMYGVNESDTLSRISTLLKTGRSDVEDRAVSLVGRVRELERKIEQLQGQLATGGSGQDPVAEAVDVNGVKLLIKRYDDTEIKGLRTILDRLRDRVTSGIIVIGGAKDGKASLLVSVSKDLVDRYNAGKLVSALAAMVGGKGGGRPDSAQGGGPDVGAIDDALAAAQEWISSQS